MTIILNIKQNSKPVENMNFMDKAVFATVNVLNNYFNLEGRASRPSLWYYFLAVFAIDIVENIMSMMTFESWLHIPVVMVGVLIGVALFLPGLGVQIRRLHDTGRSGWWFLIAFIPLIGWLIILLFLVSKGDEGDNMYGKPDNTFLSS